MSDDDPIFEVHEPNGKKYLIWVDGRVEGFDRSALILNRIAPLKNSEEWLRAQFLKKEYPNNPDDRLIVEGDVVRDAHKTRPAAGRLWSEIKRKMHL